MKKVSSSRSVNCADGLKCPVGRGGAFYYQSVKAPPKVPHCFAEPIKAVIEDNQSFGYRAVAHLLGFNKKTVPHVFQFHCRQVRKLAYLLELQIPHRCKPAGAGPDRALRYVWAREGALPAALGQRPGFSQPYHQLAACRPRISSRNTRGEMPYWFLKSLLKCAISLKPCERAMSVSVVWPVAFSNMASLHI